MSAGHKKCVSLINFTGVADAVNNGNLLLVFPTSTFQMNVKSGRVPNSNAVKLLQKIGNPLSFKRQTLPTP